MLLWLLLICVGGVNDVVAETVLALCVVVFVVAFGLKSFECPCGVLASK